MAMLSGCEELTTLTIEDLANDNIELFSQDVSAFPSDAGQVVGLTEVDWVDQSNLLVTGVVESGGGRVWRVQLDTGVIEELAYDDVLDVAVGLEGELLVLGADYFFSTDEPEPLDGDAVPAVTANGPIAYNRDGALWRLGLDEPYADFAASRLFVNRDGSIVLAIEREAIGIKLLTIESPPLAAETRTWTTVDADGEFGFFTSDGQAFVYTAKVENSSGGDRDGSEVRLLDFSGRFEISQPSDPAEPEPAALTCVAQTPPAPGDSEGMPPAVGEARDAIMAAAAGCDYAALAQLTGPDFFMGFGVADGVDPMTEWMENEERGRALATLYVDILTYDAAVRDRSDGSQVWEWPGVAAYDAIDEIPPTLLDSYLAQSGLTMAQFQDEWALFDSYPSYVIAIEPDGTWVGAWPAD